MSQNKRILLGVLILLVLAGGVLLIDVLRRSGTTSEGLDPGATLLVGLSEGGTETR